MAVHKTTVLKKHLSSAARKNKRATIWAYLKTRDRSLLRERKRNWRYQKMKIAKKIRKSGGKR